MWIREWAFKDMFANSHRELVVQCSPANNTKLVQILLGVGGI